MGKSPYDEHVLSEALEEMNDQIFSPRLAMQFRKSLFDKDEKDLVPMEAVIII